MNRLTATDYWEMALGMARCNNARHYHFQTYVPKKLREDFTRLAAANDYAVEYRKRDTIISLDHDSQSQGLTNKGLSAN